MTTGTRTSTQSVPRSSHPEGGYAAMADGSVHFISNFIETTEAWLISKPKGLATWQRLNASHDDQLLDSEKY